MTMWDILNNIHPDDQEMDLLGENEFGDEDESIKEFKQDIEELSVVVDLC